MILVNFSLLELGKHLAYGDGFSIFGISTCVQQKHLVGTLSIYVDRLSRIVNDIKEGENPYGINIEHRHEIIKLSNLVLQETKKLKDSVALNC